MTGPIPRVRRPEVRRRILEAAAEVFAERGYAAAKLEEIAFAAGFTKGALYSNFSGKPALLIELIEQYVRGRITASADELRARNQPERVLDDIAEVFAHDIIEDTTWSRLLVEIAQQATHDAEVRAVYLDVRRALRDQLADGIATACRVGGVELTVPAQQLSLVLQSLRLGLALEHGTDPERVDRASVVAVFAEVLRGSVRKPAPA